jgi:hypothetical protein
MRRKTEGLNSSFTKLNALRANPLFYLLSPTILKGLLPLIHKSISRATKLDPKREMTIAYCLLLNAIKIFLKHRITRLCYCVPVIRVRGI